MSDFTKHDWDFDEAQSVTEFFKNNGVKSKDQEFLVKECHSESGESFTAVGFNNGEKTEEGRPAMTFFCLSRKLEAQGHTLDEDFLAEHKEDIMLLEPVDGLKFGILFLANGGGRKKWSDI
jgi:hypothetical protein